MSLDKPQALIIDDEPDICELIQVTLERMDVDGHQATTLAAAREQLAQRRFNLAIVDMQLPDGNGIDMVAEMQRDYPDVPAAVITAYGNMDTAVQALKAGAFDFVPKPVDLSILRQLVDGAMELTRGPSVDRRSRHTLLGESEPMQRIRGTIVKLARSNAPVYIAGESGTGKELVARTIHDKGNRHAQPFVPINCGAIPPELMESEFFGHVKGAFTGANHNKDGLFQAADGGTLFLDEIAELPQAMQVKLLRAIQEKAVRPVGGERETPVDVRILSAANQDLARMVETGDFRQDLYYRINVIQLTVPALRERREDIPLLAEHVLERLTSGGDGARVRLSDSALAALRAYDFPGNVRELENTLERALTLCEGDTIEVEDLQLPGQGSAGNHDTRAPEPAPEPDEDFALDDYLADVERSVVIKALEKTRYNKTAAAQLLGISFRALRYKLKKLEME